MWDLSSLTRDWTHILCIGRQILTHCPTREVPLPGILILFHCVFLPVSSNCNAMKAFDFHVWCSSNLWSGLCTTIHGSPGSAPPKALGKISIINPLKDEETESQRGPASRPSDTRASNLSIPTQPMWDQPLPMGMKTSTQLSHLTVPGSRLCHHCGAIRIQVPGSLQGIIRNHPHKTSPHDWPRNPVTQEKQDLNTEPNFYS